GTMQSPTSEISAGEAPLSSSAMNSSNTKPEMGSGILLRREPRYAKDRESLPGAMVRRPNPYADIPSLYDLYVQAPSRERPPQRFGTQVFRDGLRDPRGVP